MKRLLQFKLKILAKLILAKYKPDIIGVTGSVGKTSTKEAIYTVLNTKFKVRKNIKNYNNEIGLPLTIIGIDSPGKSFFGWIAVFWRAFFLLILKEKNYPKILILEMGVDRPGDMKYLISIAKPKIGVISLIGPVHLEFFNSLDNIQKEKGIMIKNITKDGWAIINYDEEKTREMVNLSKAKVLTFGFQEGAKIRAQELIFSFDKSKEVNNLLGISFKLTYNGSFVPVLLPRVIGYNAVYAALAAAATAIAYGMNLIEISNSLKDLKSPPGRMNLIPGIKRTLIIDDSYNSSPQSAEAGINVFKKIPIVKGARRFAVLGDMLELGKYSLAGHEEIGEKVAQAKIDKLITVGERSRDIGRTAEKAGLKSDNIFHFPRAEVAGRFIQERIKTGDIIFVKGSQGIRMEKIVKEIMADPLRAGELLVRQGKEWDTKN